MNELEEIRNYDEYKTALDKQMKETAEGFVRIGYLLKLARDTDILKWSAYTNVIEFARVEYGLDKTMVSRFISINDRFSENGNSPVLKTSYKGFGYSKREIQTLKEELDEEKKISDLEVYAEGTDTEKTELEQIIYKICEENIEVYESIYNAVTHEKLNVDNIVDIFAPAGDMIYSVRIQGAGRKAVSFKQGEDIAVVSLRTSEKDTYNPQEVYIATMNIAGRNIINSEADAKTVWQQIYAKEYPKKKPLVAPVQHSSKADIKRSEKKTKVVKAKQEEIHDIEKTVPKASPIETQEPEKPIKTEAEPVDEQVEGQKNIADYPDVMPVERVEGTVESLTAEADIKNNIITAASNIKFTLEANSYITDNIIDRLIALAENIKTELEQLKGGSR